MFPSFCNEALVRTAPRNADDAASELQLGRLGEMYDITQLMYKI